MMFAGLLAFGIILFTRETRGSVILSRRAKKLRKETGNDLYQCRSDAERASLAVLLKVSMTRPLCTSLLARFDSSLESQERLRHVLYPSLLQTSLPRNRSSSSSP